jgi:hypothetical protein
MEIKYYLIAKTVPEWNSKHKNLYTCSIGYSPELGLIRVYPIPIRNDFNSGFVYDMVVNKRKIDTRKRSYELAGVYENKPQYKKLNQFNYEQLAGCLGSDIVCSIDELNRRKDSIGLIPVKDYRIDWEYGKRYINTTQIGMFEDVEIAGFTNYTKEKREKEARIKFNDADGLHDLQFNEWQVYEYGRKFGFDEDAFRFCKHKTHLLVGNMLQFQNIWMGLKFMKLIPERKVFQSQIINLYQ